MITSEGLVGASQEAIAKRANVTQSAVRHYFPKKNDLLDALFPGGIERLEMQFKQALSLVDKDPRSKLIRIASLHYDRALEVEDAAFFEAASAWSRSKQYQSVSNGWNNRLGSNYLQLIQELHPDWDRERCSATVFQIITLVLGSWATMGSSRPLFPRRSRKALKAILLEGVERLIA